MNYQRYQRRLVFSLCAASFLFTIGCGYGQVSPTTYELAQSLYTVSNRRLTDQLEAVEQRIELAQENGEVSSQEAEWLNAIANQAKRQQWKKAMKSARRVMEDQVSR